LGLLEPPRLMVEFQSRSCQSAGHLGRGVHTHVRQDSTVQILWRSAQI
jgi:hypothetical protein